MGNFIVIHLYLNHTLYYQKLKDKYKSNNNVKVFNYGLGGSTESLYLTDSGAGSEVTKEKLISKYQ
ncbi:hypothetical protein CM15mP35_09070 [bacterium]|nr:MAG: hypothetical protein CM15mP35_09070 [bacterium]